MQVLIRLYIHFNKEKPTAFSQYNIFFFYHKSSEYTKFGR
jgi:hypothetical protein